MWPFVNRRRHKRYPVSWDAVIHCDFPDREATVRARVAEASLHGARLMLERLQYGPHHLVANDYGDAFELTIHLPEAPVTSKIDILWYNWNDEEQLFTVGVEFTEMTNENRVTLQQAVKRL